MTETFTVQRPLFGQQLGETVRETRVLVDRVLAKENTTFERWVALNTLGTQGPAIAQDQLWRDLAVGLQKEPSAVSRLLAELETEGLVDSSAAQVSLTAAGATHYKHLREQIQGTSARLLEGVDSDDVETTLRVLATVKERAKALRAQTT